MFTYEQNSGSDEEIKSAYMDNVLSAFRND